MGLLDILNSSPEGQGLMSLFGLPSPVESDWLGKLLAAARNNMSPVPARAPNPIGSFPNRSNPTTAPAITPHPIAALDLPPVINTTQQAPLDTLDVNSINESIRKFLAGYLPGATGISPAGPTMQGRSTPTGTPGLPNREAPVYYR